jgi:Cof subfamily protein (haloacid dehalogenase superfamily)
MIRCIAIDLDDTLLRSDLTISSIDKTAIQKAIDKGIKVLLASGRMVQSMRPYIRELQIDLPIIAYNGAIIQETMSDEILYHCPVPTEEALKLVLIFREAGIHLNAYINDELYMDELTEWGEKYAANARVIPRPVGDLTQYLTEPPHKMLALGEVNKVDFIQAQLQGKFGEGLQFVKSKPTYLEILAPRVSKGMALQKLVKTWGFERNEVMAIGDAPNDLSMITWAGAGVAVGNATPLVKEKAVLVVADHDHNGVAEALERLVFN